MHDNRGGQFWKYPFIALALALPLILLQFINNPLFFADFAFFSVLLYLDFADGRYGTRKVSCEGDRGAPIETASAGQTTFPIFGACNSRPCIGWSVYQSDVICFGCSHLRSAYVVEPRHLRY